MERFFSSIIESCVYPRNLPFLHLNEVCPWLVTMVMAPLTSSLDQQKSISGAHFVLGTCHRHLLQICGKLSSDKLLSLFSCCKALLLLQLTSQASPAQRESRPGSAVPFLTGTCAQQAAKSWGLPEKHPTDLTKEHTTQTHPMCKSETYPIRISLWQSWAINDFPSHIIDTIKNTSS